MNASEYTSMDAMGLADLVRKKEVTPKELLSIAIELVEAINPKLNVISFRAYDLAAQQIEKELDMNAPFAGVPMLLKDSGAIAKGIPASIGSRLAKGRTAERDTELVARFKKAGFIIIGTTATPEFCFTSTTESVLSPSVRQRFLIETVRSVPQFSATIYK